MLSEPRRGHTFRELREAQLRVREQPKVRRTRPLVDPRFGRVLILAIMGAAMIWMLQTIALPQLFRTIADVAVGLFIALDIVRVVVDS